MKFTVTILLCSSFLIQQCFIAQENEEILCQKGIQSAKLKRNCENSTNFSFKNCCKACKFGIEMKIKFGYCIDKNLIKFDIINDCCDSAGQKLSTDMSQYCSSSRSPCNNQTQICVNTFNSFRCECKDGFELNDNDNSCTDINECENGTNDCKTYEICINEVGTFRCEKSTCPKGFIQKIIEGVDGVECVDFDECTENPCRIDEICDNTIGSYNCEQRDILNKNCLDGYEMANDTCKDIDECAKGVCKKNEICTNLEGSFRCEKIECEKGYERFSKSNCRRKHCIGNCVNRPRKILNFFAVVYPWEHNKKIFSISVPSKNIKMRNFDNNFFEIKETSRGIVIIMRKAPMDDQKLELKFNVYNKRSNFKGTNLYVFHVYVNK